MELKKLFSLFLRSPLAAGMVSFNAVLAVFALLLPGVPWLIVFPAFFLVSGIEIAAVFASEKGSRALIREKDREQQEHDNEKLLRCEQARKALTMIRIESPTIISAAEKLSLSAGRYLENCAKGGLRDPLAEEALLAGKDAVMMYQKSLDDAEILKMTGTQSSEHPDTEAALSEKEVAEYLTSLAIDIQNRITPLNLEFQDTVKARKELDE